MKSLFAILYFFVLITLDITFFCIVIVMIKRLFFQGPYFSKSVNFSLDITYFSQIYVGLLGFSNLQQCPALSTPVNKFSSAWNALAWPHVLSSQSREKVAFVKVPTQCEALNGVGRLEDLFFHFLLLWSRTICLRSTEDSIKRK